MKILFIAPKIGSQAKLLVGIAYLSAVLKETGHEVELLEIDEKKDLDKIFLTIESFNPQIIGLTANSHQYDYAVDIARDIKSKFNAKIFLGGVHSTLAPENAVKEKCFDGVCVGEGEEAFLELIGKIENHQDYFDTKNFWFYKDGDLIKNDIRPIMNDLNSLPMPDYSIFKYYKSAGSSEIVPRFIFSRGCPFNCTYCCNHAIKRIYIDQSNYVRFRSVEKSLAEIDLIKSKYNFKHFKIDDDTFSLNKKWVLEFCEKYKAKFNMTFECNVRVGAVDREILEALKSAGCNLIKVGVESGNEKLRREVLNRQIFNGKIIELFDLAREVGLKTFSFNMIGVPGETKSTVKDTINLNARLRPDYLQVTAFYPYPSTALGDRCLKEGLIGDYHLDSYMKESVLNLPTLSRGQIERAVKYFKFNVYRQYDRKRAVAEIKVVVKNSIIRNKFLYKPVRLFYNLAKKIKLNIGFKV